LRNGVFVSSSGSVANLTREGRSRSMKSIMRDNSGSCLSPSRAGQLLEVEALSHLIYGDTGSCWIMTMPDKENAGGKRLFKAIQPRLPRLKHSVSEIRQALPLAIHFCIPIGCALLVCCPRSPDMCARAGRGSRPR
jgi:hypothetical protein